jgi:hypothetical protein
LAPAGSFFTRFVDLPKSLLATGNPTIVEGGGDFHSRSDCGRQILDRFRKFIVIGGVLVDPRNPIFADVCRLDTSYRIGNLVAIMAYDRDDQPRFRQNTALELARALDDQIEFVNAPVATKATSAEKRHDHFGFRQILAEFVNPVRSNLNALV